MPATRYRLRPLTNGKTATIFLDFTYNGNRIKYNTGFEILIKDWVESRHNLRVQRLNNKVNGAQQINQALDQLEERVLSIYNSFTSKGEVPSVKQLKELITPRTTIESSVVKFLDEFTQHERDSIGLNKLKHHILLFEKHKGSPMDWKTMDKATFTNLIHFLCYDVEQKYRKRTNKGLTNATVNKTIKNLKRLCKAAAIAGHPVPPDYLNLKVLEENAQPEHITIHELKKLRAFDFTTIEDKGHEPNRLNLIKACNEVVDVYTFCFDTCLSHSDAFRITPEHVGTVLIDGQPVKALHYYRKKTRKPHIIPLTQRCLELIDKYKDHTPGKVLPVKSLNKTNRALKNAFRLAGFTEEKIHFQMVGYGVRETHYKRWERLTIHTARHSGITHLMRMNVPPIKVKNYANHSDLKTTMKYEHLGVEDYAGEILKAYNSKQGT